MLIATSSPASCNLLFSVISEPPLSRLLIQRATPNNNNVAMYIMR